MKCSQFPGKNFVWRINKSSREFLPQERAQRFTAFALQHCMNHVPLFPAQPRPIREKRRAPFFKTPWTTNKHTAASSNTSPIKKSCLRPTFHGIQVRNRPTQQTRGVFHLDQQPYSSPPQGCGVTEYVSKKTDQIWPPKMTNNILASFGSHTREHSVNKIWTAFPLTYSFTSHP